MFIGRMVRGVDLNAFQPEGMHSPAAWMPFQRHLLNPARLEFPSTSKLLIIHAGSSVEYRWWVEDRVEQWIKGGVEVAVRWWLLGVVSFFFFFCGYLGIVAGNYRWIVSRDFRNLYYCTHSAWSFMLDFYKFGKLFRTNVEWYLFVDWFEIIGAKK